MRYCAHCDTEIPDGRPDACLGHLEGVIQACCGHGMTAHPYVAFNDEDRLDGIPAIRYFESVGHAPPPLSTYREQIVEQHEGQVRIFSIRLYQTGALRRIEWENSHPTLVPVWLVNSSRFDLVGDGSLRASDPLTLETA